MSTNDPIDWLKCLAAKPSVNPNQIVGGGNQRISSANELPSDEGAVARVKVNRCGICQPFYLHFFDQVHYHPWALNDLTGQAQMKDNRLQQRIRDIKKGESKDRPHPFTRRT